MLILCDNLDYSYNYFSPSNYKCDDIELDLNYISNSFFNKTSYKYYSSNGFWNLALINQFIDKSQFDLLNKLSNDGIVIPDRTICLAGSGSKFHGFHARKWESLEGNIHLSCYFKPNMAISKLGLSFTMIAAVSVIDTLDEISELKNKAMIKWVNDIVINNSKICGVIAKNQIRNMQITDAVIGIGLNVEKSPNITPTSIIPNATCINDIISLPRNIFEITNILLDKIELNYNILLEFGAKPILDKYLERSLIIGKYINVWSDLYNTTPSIINSGKVVSIGENLELYLENTKEPILNGRIEIIDF